MSAPFYIPKLEVAAKSYIGMPYVNKKIQKNVKPMFTCWSFIHHMYTQNFTITLDKNILASAEKFVQVWCTLDNTPWLPCIAEWDMLLIRTNNVVVDHAALAIYPDKLVHCIPAVGVCIEPIAKYETQLFQIVRLQHLY